MKVRNAAGGFTAGAVLIVGVLAGLAGGAVAMSGSDPAPAAPVTLHQVAEEPTAAPAPTVTPTAAPVVDEPEPAPKPVVHDDPAPVSDRAPIVAPVAPKAETASEAADRAKVEADRAKTEADRATEVAAPKPPATPPGALLGGATTAGSTSPPKNVIPGLDGPESVPKPAPKS